MALFFLQLITAEANSRLRICECKQVWFHLVPDFILFFSNILYFSIFIPRFLTHAPFKLQQNLTSDKSPPLEFLDASIYKKSICYSSCAKHICTVHWGWTTKKAFQKKKNMLSLTSVFVLLETSITQFVLLHVLTRVFAKNWEMVIQRWKLKPALTSSTGR